MPDFTTEPRTTAKELQASVSSVRVRVHDSTIRKRPGNINIHGKTTADQKGHKGNENIWWSYVGVCSITSWT